jgi:hypothetical protein
MYLTHPRTRDAVREGDQVVFSVTVLLVMGAQGGL